MKLKQAEIALKYSATFHSWRKTTLPQAEQNEYDASRVALQSIIVSLLTEAKLASEQAMTVDKTNSRYVYRAFRIVIVLAMV